MITVTLNFKTIEAARKALLEIPSSALVGGPEPEPEPEAEAPKPAPARAAASGKATAKGGAAPGKTAAEKAPAAESVAAEPPASTAAASSPAPAPAPAPAVEYTVLQKAVFTLAGKSREAAAAVAASFGVKTFKDLPADKWADALAAVNAKLAELEGV